MFRKKKSSKIGERNVKCDDVILCGHHLDEPKYGIVQNFYKYLASSDHVSFAHLNLSDLSYET